MHAPACVTEKLNEIKQRVKESFQIKFPPLVVVTICIYVRHITCVKNFVLAPGSNFTQVGVINFKRSLKKSHLLLSPVFFFG